MPFQNPALVMHESVKVGFFVHHALPGATAATAANWGKFWIAPAKCVVDSCVVVYSANSNSGTLQLMKTPSGTAQDSGTNLLSAVINVATGANTNQTGSLVTVAATLELAAGDSLQIVDGGTMTSLTDLVVTVGLHWIV